MNVLEEETNKWYRHMQKMHWLTNEVPHSIRRITFCVCFVDWCQRTNDSIEDDRKDTYLNLKVNHSILRSTFTFWNQNHTANKYIEKIVVLILSRVIVWRKTNEKKIYKFSSHSIHSIQKCSSNWTKFIRYILRNKQIFCAYFSHYVLFFATCIVRMGY